MSLETQSRLVLANGEIITDQKKIQEITDSADKVGHPNALEILAQTELKPEIITAAMLYIGEIEEFFPGVDEITDSHTLYQRPDLNLDISLNNQRGIRPFYHFYIQTNNGPITVEVTDEPLTTNNFDTNLQAITEKLNTQDLTEEERMSLETQRDSLLLKMKEKIIAQLKKQIDANQAQ